MPEKENQVGNQSPLALNNLKKSIQVKRKACFLEAQRRIARKKLLRKKKIIWSVTGRRKSRN